MPVVGSKSLYDRVIAPLIHSTDSFMQLIESVNNHNHVAQRRKTAFV